MRLVEEQAAQLGGGSPGPGAWGPGPWQQPPWQRESGVPFPPEAERAMSAERGHKKAKLDTSEPEGEEEVAAAAALERALRSLSLGLNVQAGEPVEAPPQAPLLWRVADIEPERGSPFASHRWAPFEARLPGLGPGATSVRAHFRVHALTLRPEVLAELSGVADSGEWDRPEGFDVKPPPSQAVDPSPGRADLPQPLTLGRGGGGGAEFESAAPCGRPDTLRAREGDAGASALRLPERFAPVFGCGPDAQRNRGVLARGRNSHSLGLYGGVDETAEWDPWGEAGADDVEGATSEERVRGTMLRISRAAVQSAEDEERRAKGRAAGAWPRFAEPPEGWVSCFRGEADIEMDSDRGAADGVESGASPLRPHAHARATWHGTVDLLPSGAWVLLAPGAGPPPLGPDQVDRCFLEPVSPEGGGEQPGGGAFAAVRARPGEVILFPGWVPQCSPRPSGGEGALRVAAAFNYYLE